jgi:hypothetical protein
MTAETVFTAANFTALAGWALLAAGVVFSNAMLRDFLAGRIVPAILAAAYTALILFNWAGSQGGFSSLADVAGLFANPWLLLAGWVHYLAFDLAIGSAVARKTSDQRLPRLILVPILPLIFLFGPIGWLIFEAVSVIAPRFMRKAAA